MLRLPSFTYHGPTSLAEAVDLLASAPGDCAVVAGGTDLLPNMKRRQQTPAVLVGLRQIAELRGLGGGGRGGWSESADPGGLGIGATTTLGDLVASADLRRRYTGLWQAAAQVATPHLRNMGTIGGNLCLDTRCNYYDQSYEWRKAIDFCMKKDGQVCWVAPSSPRCLAVSSSDTAPALAALDAAVVLVDAAGARRVRVVDLYRNDGIHYLTRRPGEILARIELADADGWRSTYWKLRRRGSFDFPVLSVAVAARLGADGTVHAARLVLGAVASMPIEVPGVGAFLAGRPLDDAIVEEAAERAAQPARPMDNTDFSLHWRKHMVRELAACALRELRGDDVRGLRRKISRLESLVPMT